MSHDSTTVAYRPVRPKRARKAPAVALDEAWVAPQHAEVMQRAQPPLPGWVVPRTGPYGRWTTAIWMAAILLVGSLMNVPEIGAVAALVYAGLAIQFRWVR
jgi:hypothetical protein